MPELPWLGVLETDHFFAESLEDLAAACDDAITWALG